MLSTKLTANTDLATDLITVVKESLPEPVVIRMTPFQLSKLNRINLKHGLELEINLHSEPELWSADELLENIGFEDYAGGPPDDGSDEKYEEWKDAAV